MYVLDLVLDLYLYIYIYKTKYELYSQIDTKLDIVFDPECQGSGLYNGELDEPEYANAHNTCLYELYLLKV